MENKDGHLYDLIVTPSQNKVYGWLLVIWVASIGVGVMFAKLLGKPLNYAFMISTLGYLCFIFLRVYISRNHLRTREKLKSASPDRAWSVMVGGYLWALPAFAVFVLIYNLSMRVFA